MAPPIHVDIPHDLGRAEARRRLDAGFTNVLQGLPGHIGDCKKQWDGDKLTFSVTTMGQTVAGVIDVLDAVVKMQIELPGVLGLIAGAFKGRLQKAGQLLLTKK